MEVIIPTCPSLPGLLLSTINRWVGGDLASSLFITPGLPFLRLFASTETLYNIFDNMPRILYKRRTAPMGDPGTILNVVSWILLAVVICALIARFTMKLSMKTRRRRFGLDDLFIAFAAVSQNMPERVAGQLIATALQLRADDNNLGGLNTCLGSTSTRAQPSANGHLSKGLSQHLV
jgi:hypothetical protein